MSEYNFEKIQIQLLLKLNGEAIEEVIGYTEFKYNSC